MTTDSVSWCHESVVILFSAFASLKAIFRPIWALGLLVFVVMTVNPLDDYYFNPEIITPLVGLYTGVILFIRLTGKGMNQIYFLNIFWVIIVFNILSINI